MYDISEGVPGGLLYSKEDLYRFSKVFIKGQTEHPKFYAVPVFELPPFLLAGRKFVV